MTLYTSTTAAVEIGCHSETVRRIAKRLKLGELLPVGLVFSQAEVERIRGEVKPIGCPKFKAGNKLWKKRKKLK